MSAFEFDGSFEVVPLDARYQVARRRSGVVSREAERLALATIPARYANYDRSHWRGPWPIPDRLATWPKDSAPWAVLFLGSVGVGKTMAATALFRDAVSRCCGGFWVDFKALLTAKQRAMDTHAPCPAAAACESPKLVLIDDLGAERKTTWTVSETTGILDLRYREGWPTIITSNAQSLAGLAESMDTRLVSRIAEGEVVVLNGPDRRIHGLAS